MWQVCDYVIGVTNGDNPRDVVPIFQRLPILQTWVKAKQMAQQQISKLPGSDDHVSVVFCLYWNHEILLTLWCMS